MGVRLDNMAEADAVGHIFACLAAGQGGYMVNPNVDVMRQIVASAELRELVAGASLVLPDGMPLLWAAQAQGTPLKQRVPVSEAIGPLCAEAARQGTAVFLLGGPPGTAQRAGEVLAARYGGLKVAHACPPFGFESDDGAMRAIGEAIRDAGPGLVFCAFGFPKQERLMAALSRQFPGTWFIGSGGTFSMVAGDTPKAPAWMRRSGLEWLHRLRLEPRRLFERYIVHDLPFAFRLLSWSALARSKRRGAGAQPPVERTRR